MSAIRYPKEVQTLGVLLRVGGQYVSFGLVSLPRKSNGKVASRAKIQSIIKHPCSHDFVYLLVTDDIEVLNAVCEKLNYELAQFKTLLKTIVLDNKSQIISPRCAEFSRDGDMVLRLPKFNESEDDFFALLGFDMTKCAPKL